MTMEDRMNKKKEKYEEKLWSTRMPTTVTDRKALGLIIGTTGTVMECNAQPFNKQTRRLLQNGCTRLRCYMEKPSQRQVNLVVMTITAAALSDCREC